ncbi:MAG: CehA/McbA family metallohydrolase [Planctomycetes bacterium]|nr:CehA/McbA family metallohydrolase [Planctomycetota bacterium]
MRSTAAIALAGASCLAPALCLAAALCLASARAQAQTPGQFDTVPVNPVDEAYIFTPPGFEREGKPAVASGAAVGRVHVVARDRATGRPTPCRANVVGPDGDYYRPAPGRLTPYDLTGAYPKGLGNRPSKAPIRYLGRSFYTSGDFTVEVPSGEVRIEVWKGFEIAPRTAAAKVAAGAAAEVEVVLDRTVPMSELGWWSGDPHLHFDRRGAEDDETILDLLEAEDIQHGAVLCYNADTARYTGLMEAQATPQLVGLGARTVRSRGPYSILSGQEYRSVHYGHMLLFLREDMALAGSTLDPGTWPVFGVVARETRERGGHAVYAHGGYAQEVIADSILGDAGAVELLQFGIYRGIGLEGWYALLSAGFRFPATGASDYPMCRFLGDARTYVHHGGRPTFAEWIQGAAEGRSFVTTGPLLLLEIEGKLPGAVLERSGPGLHSVHVKARVRSEVAPVTSLQVIVNGRTAVETAVPAIESRGRWIEIEGTLGIARSSWIAARASSRAPGGSPDADAHTNPVYLHVDGKAPYEPEAVERLLALLDRQIAALERRIFPRQLDALAHFRRARERLLEVRAGGGQPAKAERDAPRPEGRSAGRAEEDPLEALLVPVPPKEPAEALAALDVLQGFRVTLVASEPLVTSPIAGAFDEDGRLYVCEMRDYPYKPGPGGTPLGRVSLLEDEDGDGRFERGTAFAEGLLWPSGVAPWKGGAYVAAAPDIWYLRDSDGDRRADERRRVYTGFGTGNQQGMLNNLAWGLDHRVYGASSMEGGEVRPADRPDAPPVSVRGRDFRFDPVSGAFEAVAGTAQFGNAFDDWGNRFTCSESRPALHVVLPGDREGRNPHFAPPGAVHDIAEGGTRLFKVSPVEGWRLVRSSRRVETEYLPASSAAVSHDIATATAGVAIYRGDAYPEAFRGNLVVSDAQLNVVHRRRLEPDGVTFKAFRADEGTELVRSPDIWFRPVNLLNAPDGTLYALDMCRETIESVHIPLDVARRLDLTSGRDRGRIWRIEPEGFRPRPPPRLSRASTLELVAALESPNGWRRDAAHRLLFERQDAAAAAPLRRLLGTSRVPVARLHALGSLEGLGALEERDLLAALADPAPGVREAALRIAEPRLAGSPRHLEEALALAGDPVVRVRFQTAFALGATEDPRAVQALAAIASGSPADPWVRAAVLSSAATRAGRIFEELCRDPAFHSSAPGRVWLDALARTAGGRADRAEVQRVLEALARLREGGVDAGFERRAVLALVAGGSLEAMPANLSGPARRVIDGALAWAREAVAGGAAGEPGEASEANLVQAVEIAARGRRDPELRDALARLLVPARPQGVRIAAVRALRGWDEPAVADLLLGSWPSYSPAVRTEALEALLSRKAWLLPFLAAVEEGHVAPGEVDAARRPFLLEHADPEVRAKAAALLAPAGAKPRGEILAAYREALRLEGDPARGERVFDAQCAKCHAFGAKGHAVGASLALTQSRTPEALLEAILDPNRDVSPAYVEHAVVDREGRVFTGIIANETAVAITLRRAEGLEDSVLRRDIAEVRSTGKSLMPEGLEAAVPPRDMADLIAFVLRGRYDLGTDPGILEPAAAPAAPAAVIPKPVVPAPAGIPLPEEPRIAAQLRASLERFVTAEDWRARRAALREGVLRGAGLWPLPERPPIRAIIHGRREHPGYSVENVALETLPGFFLTGNLYRPLGRKGPHAAVLCPHGHFQPRHGAGGRFRPDQQARCAHLARMGAVVLSYGMVGWQDSRQATHDDPLVLALQLWGSIRALDHVSSLDGVDSRRIGITGASGGGTQTFLLAAADERVAASAPLVIVYPWSWFSDGCCRCENGLPILRSPETNAIELAAAAAPRPQLIVSCGLLEAGKEAKDPTHDFPRTGFPFIREVYRRCGAEARLRSLHLAGEGHDYGPTKRKAVYAFLAEALGLELLEEDLATIAIEPPEVLEVFGPRHPLPPHAIQGSAAVAEALGRLPGVLRR